MNKKWSLTVLILSVVTLSGCADIDSGNIRTAGICANISVKNTATNKVYVYTTLTAGCGLGGSYVKLDNGDTLTADYLSTRYSQLRTTKYITNITYYTTTTNDDYMAGEQVSVGLDRDPGYVDALFSYVTLPASFTVTTPANGTSYSAGQTIKLAWTGTHPSTDIDFDLDCHFVDGSDSSVFIGRSSSTNTYSMTVTELKGIVNNPADEPQVLSCSGTVEMTGGSVYGVPDPALDPASRIRASYVQSRSISVTF